MLKKQKVTYQLYRYRGPAKTAEREIPFEWKLTAQLLLDEVCFKWNKERLQIAINHSLDTGDKARFKQLSHIYQDYIWE